MKRLFLLALAALIPIAGDAQTRIDRAVLMAAYDLDGEAADADQIVTAANGDLLDSATFTLTADPDVCRLVDMTVTDANSSISAGVLTVAGTGCLNETRSCTFTFAAGGSGVKTLTCTDGQGAYFADVTSVTTGTLTGEGGAGVDFMTLGYTSNSVNGWAVYGARRQNGPIGERGVDVHGTYEVAKKVTTSGSLSTTVAGVTDADDPYEVVAVGDLLIFQISGTMYERKVTARASADSITVNSAISIPAAGVTFKYKKQFFSTNPADDLSFSVAGYKTLNLNWSVDANANTGGVVTLFECTTFGPEYPNAQWITLNTTTVASAATQVPTTEAVDLTALPYNRCRLGLSFGSGDDADAAAEDVNASITLMN